MRELLHCMPCGPRNWGGRPAREYDWHYAPKHRVYGRAVVYELPAGATPEPVALLQALGDTSGCANAEATKRLIGLIDENSRTIALPPAALVSGASVDGDTQSKSLLDVLTVLAKSSGLLYLRDKCPNIQNIGRVRRVVLVIPPSWRPAEVNEKGAA